MVLLVLNRCYAPDGSLFYSLTLLVAWVLCLELLVLVLLLSGAVMLLSSKYYL
jgi:hypothetical protein